MTEAAKILEVAYLDTAAQISEGCRKLPTAFARAWECVTSGHAAMVEFQDKDLMYIACYSAALEYSRTAHVGVDEAFSTVACTIGIVHQSADWYRVMAHHYTHQAARRDAETEVD